MLFTLRSGKLALSFHSPLNDGVKSVHLKLRCTTSFSNWDLKEANKKRHKDSPDTLSPFGNFRPYPKDSIFALCKCVWVTQKKTPILSETSVTVTYEISASWRVLYRFLIGDICPCTILFSSLHWVLRPVDVRISNF